MRILLVVHSPPPADCFSPSGGAGGTEIYTSTLARELGRSEEVLVFTRIADPGLPEYDISRKNYQGVEYRAVNNTYRQGNDFELHYHNPSLDKPFEECLKEFRPEIVHFTYVLGGLSASFVRLARESGAGVVITLTDYNLICPWG
ncbi:MAG: glycosyltransferase, partial [Deltaproteobacteria bacterium]